MGLTLRRWALVLGVVLVCSAWALQGGPSDAELWKTLTALFAAALTAILGLLGWNSRRPAALSPSPWETERSGIVSRLETAEKELATVRSRLHALGDELHTLTTRLAIAETEVVAIGRRHRREEEG